MNQMYCSNCGKEISNDVKFCKFCGYPVNNVPTVAPVISEPVSQAMTDTKQNANSEQNLVNSHLVQSEWLFLLINLITFGLYTFYWGWKNWEIIHRGTGEKMQSGWRGFFIIFTCFSLFKQTLELAKKEGYQSSYPRMVLGVGFFIALLVNRASGAEGIDALAGLVIGCTAVAVASFLVFPVIEAMNYYVSHSNEEGLKTKIKPNWALAILLAIFFFASFASGWNAS